LKESKLQSDHPKTLSEEQKKNYGPAGGRNQAPAVISHFGLLVGPGRPWSALVGNSRLQVGGFPVPGSNIEKLRQGGKPI
jgi:hypothetical protein